MSYPLIFNKLPSAFEHQCTSWVISQQDALYNDCLLLIHEWYTQHPKGSSIVVDVFSPVKAALSSLDASSWYVIDLRLPAETSTKASNEIHLPSLRSLCDFDQGQILFDIYSRVKGLVVFASSPKDLPINLRHLCVLSMVAQEKEMTGTHRFEEQEKSVSWG